MLLSDSLFPVVSHTAFVAESATVVGDVLLADKSNVWYNCVLRGDLGPIYVGAYSNVQDTTTILTTGPQGVTIGDYVTIGHHAFLQGCSVGKEGFIGMNSKVLDGAVVQSRGMVAANAVVAPGTVVPSGELWGGVPARKLRNLTEDEIEYLATWATEYSVLADEHKELQEPGSLVYTEVEKIRSRIGEGPFVNKYSA